MSWNHPKPGRFEEVYMEQRITDDIDELKLILPTYINDALDRLGNTDDL